MKYFKKLIASLSDSNQKNKLLILAYKYNKFAEAEDLANEKLSIDTWEMDSLIDPSGYEIKAPEIDEVVVNVSENS